MFVCVCVCVCVCVYVCVGEGGDGVSSWEGKDSTGERGANRSQMCAVKTYGFR